MRSLLALLILSLAASACQSSQQAEEAQQAWDAVMVVHDEAMAQMGALNRTKTQLQAYLDETPELEETTQEEIEQAIETLSAAQDGMMSWMSKLVSPLDSLQAGRSHAEVMAYLEAEQAAVEGVQKAMENALEGGQALLSRIEER